MMQHSLALKVWARRHFAHPFSPSLRLFLSFPFWVPLGEVGGIGTSSFPCDEHKSCTNRIQTWGSWWALAADRVHKRSWHRGKQQQVLIKQQMASPVLPHYLSLSHCLSLSFCSTVAGANKMSAWVLQCKLSQKHKEKTIQGKNYKKCWDSLTSQSSLKGCLV